MIPGVRVISPERYLYISLRVPIGVFYRGQYSNHSIIPMALLEDERMGLEALVSECITLMDGVREKGCNMPLSTFRWSFTPVPLKMYQDFIR